MLEAKGECKIVPPLFSTSLSVWEFMVSTEIILPYHLPKAEVKEFLLYPTISYTLKDNFLDSFQENYKDFVKDN